MNYSGNGPWPALLMGVLVLFIGLRALITGESGTFRDIPLVDWVGFVLVPLGLSMIILSIRSLRTWKKPGPSTDDDIRQAKEKLDQMYLREHGTLPGAQQPQAPESPAPEQAAAPARPAAPQPEAAARPEAPTHEEAKLKTAPEPPTPEQNARIARANTRIRQGLLLMLAGGLVFYAASGALALIPAVALFLVGLTRLAVGLVERS